MENRTMAGLIAIVAIVAMVMVTGSIEKNQVDVEQVRQYANPITENILLAMNEDNYTRYSEHFDQTMKNATHEAVFNETNAVIKSKIGDYVSKDFWKVECEDQYTIVYYNASFTEEPEDVVVTVAFQEIAGEMKVSGLWLDSPKLRENDVDQMRQYADPITENILLAMNEDNYTRYSEHFDQTMKNATHEAVFNETNAVIKSKIGDYVSKDFWKVECEDQYTIVYYNASFTEEPEDVVVTVAFQEIAGEMKVSGLWLDSPKLREK